jgi:cytidyltransferase-like protein
MNCPSEDIQKDKYKTAIFSGRFDPPHLGHVQTILKIAKRFSKVVVVILDYPERKVVNAMEAKDIFDYLFDMVFPETCRSKVDVVINNIHFGKIKFSEYDCFLRNIGACYNHTVYLTGNFEVLVNMQEQQIKHEFIERSIDAVYEGKKIREDLGLEFEK